MGSRLPRRGAVTPISFAPLLSVLSRRIQSVVATVPLLEVVVAVRGRPGVSVAVRAGFWDGIRSGLGAAGGCGCGWGAAASRRQAWFREAGGVTAAGAVAPGGAVPVAGGAGGDRCRAWRRGCAAREIARRLGRPASTVSREIRRNSGAAARRYRATAAQARARAAGAAAQAGEAGDERRAARVGDGKLELNWSPEQISAALGGSSRTGRRCGCRTETICQSALRAGPRGAAAGAGAAPADRAGAAQAAAQRGRAAGQAPGTW